MTDRRPPIDAALDTESEPADAGQEGQEGQEGLSDGKRSQTLPAGASGARRAVAAAPRSTFGDAQPEPQRPARPESGSAQTPRSVFQPAAPRAPAPTATDSDKTVKRAYPNAWGATLLVGNAVPPPDGARPATDTEKTVVSEFPPPATAGRAEPQRNAPPHAGAEPLRVPSNRPAPAPFQQTRAARSGTLLMPGANADDLAAHASKPAAPSARPNPPPSANAPGAQHAVPPPPPSPTPDRAARAANALETAPAGKATAATPVHRTEPLQLSLDARDMVPKAGPSVRPGIPHSRGPLIVVTAGVGVLVLIAAVAWFKHRAPAAGAPAEALAAPPRSSAVAAVPVTTPSAVPAQQPSAAAVQKPAAAPAAHAQPAAKPSAAAATESKPAAAAAKPSQHQAAPKAHAGARKAPSENSEGIEDARAALKALESPPVVRVKRKADDEARAPAGDEGTPPAPPPLPDPEGE